jgi:hypothetical protein
VKDVRAVPSTQWGVGTTARAAFNRRKERKSWHKIRTKASVDGLAKQLIAGTAKHLVSGTQVTLLGSSYTAADLTTNLQKVVSLQSDVDASKALAKAKLTAQATGMASLRPLMGALVAYVKVTYGNQPDVLADFGVAAPKPRAALTVEAKAAAAAKRASTRKARGTMGPVQKLAVVGDVTGVTITPTTAAHPIATPVVSPSNSPTVGAPSPAPTATPTPHAAT